MNIVVYQEKDGKWKRPEKAIYSSGWSGGPNYCISVEDNNVRIWPTSAQLSPIEDVQTVILSAYEKLIARGIGPNTRCLWFARSSSQPHLGPLWQASFRLDDGRPGNLCGWEEGILNDSYKGVATLKELEKRMGLWNGEGEGPGGQIEIWNTILHYAVKVPEGVRDGDALLADTATILKW